MNYSRHNSYLFPGSEIEIGTTDKNDYRGLHHPAMDFLSGCDAKVSHLKNSLAARCSQKPSSAVQVRQKLCKSVKKQNLKLGHSPLSLSSNKLSQRSFSTSNAGEKTP
jgi:hypothetical protein